MLCLNTTAGGESVLILPPDQRPKSAYVRSTSSDTWLLFQLVVVIEQLFWLGRWLDDIELLSYHSSPFGGKPG